MNALERLTAFLCARPGTENMDEWHADWAKALLDQHAHELADQIRKAPFEPHLLQRHQRYAAARIIDPEAKK